MITRKCLMLMGCGVLMLTMSGCGDKVAEDLARHLAAVADTYQEQVDRSNEAERDAYKKLASIYVEAERSHVLVSLEQERIERAGHIADEMAEAKKASATLSDIQRELRDYANFDSENTRKLMKDESEASAQYLAQLAKLNSSSAKVEALSKGFAALAKSKGRRQQVQELASFFEETKKEVDKLFCDELATSIKGLDETVSAQKIAPQSETPDQRAKRLVVLASLEAELDTANKQKEAKKCQ